MKKIAVILALAGAVALSVLLWQADQKEKQQDVQFEQMEKELAPLNVQKRELEQQIAEFDAQTAQKIEKQGTVVVLFTEARKEVYTQAYPIMKKYGYPGVIAISNTQFPGEEGCMSVGQFQKLLKAGWSYAIRWENESDVEKWHTQLDKKLKKLKLPKSNVMYFASGTYRKETDAQLVKLGYQMVAHHGEEGLSVIPKTMEEPLWYPGVYGMQGNSPRAQLEETIERGSNIVYGVGFTKSDEKFEASTFDSMLGWFRSYENEKQLTVTDFAGALKYQQKLAKQTEEFQNEKKEEQQTLESQLQEIEKQIDQLYQKYVK